MLAVQSSTNELFMVQKKAVTTSVRDSMVLGLVYSQNQYKLKFFLDEVGIMIVQGSPMA